MFHLYYKITIYSNQRKRSFHGLILFLASGLSINSLLGVPGDEARVVFPGFPVTSGHALHLYYSMENGGQTDQLYVATQSQGVTTVQMITDRIYNGTGVLCVGFDVNRTLDSLEIVAQKGDNSSQEIMLHMLEYVETPCPCKYLLT